MPSFPGPNRWVFPDVEAAGKFVGEDCVAFGADLEPETLMAAYASGLFPMGSTRRPREISWWSPCERGVLRPRELRLSRSLAKSRRAMEIRCNTRFSEVVSACAADDRPGRWITPAIAAAYQRLHELGWAHSVEAWQGGQLVGGLYGLAIGGLFAGESMFHRVSDASKVALVGLCELLDDSVAEDRLIDTQWVTPHLATLGVTPLARHRYLTQLPGLLLMPPPAAFDPGSANPAL